MEPIFIDMRVVCVAKKVKNLNEPAFDLILQDFKGLITFQVMIQPHNRHASFSLYVSALACTDTAALLMGNISQPCCIQSVADLGGRTRRALPTDQNFFNFIGFSIKYY